MTYIDAIIRRPSSKNQLDLLPSSASAHKHIDRLQLLGRSIYACTARRNSTVQTEEVIN